ncbi:HD domain-containing protein [Thermosipho ferrireducens]|uniref:HD domain-containing protein n=1 Tax=Thermosipho ferrireducens TaxID=2571116 RepID=A0ABX7SA48_9BACT|nr:HD domain-containing phosphohydrolase [Thermosipho ferrireducens]QTA38130.1 HD domain-containing protein [Thermosipho ferrireducens]
MFFDLKNFILLYNEIGYNEYKDFILHSFHVAKFSALIAKELGFQNYGDIYVIGLLHDAGFLTINELLNVINQLKKYNNLSRVDNLEEIGFHSTLSCYLLKNTGLFDESLAESVKYHHSEYSDNGLERIVGSILKLADTISWFFFQIKSFEDYAAIIPDIWKRLENEKIPDNLKNTAISLLKDYKIIDKLIDNKPHMEMFGNFNKNLSANDCVNLSKIIAFIQEIRSPTTKDHVFLVSKVSQKLGEYILGKADGTLLKVSGYLHDLGKLKTPLKILHKRGTLTEVERILIQKHVFDTIDMLLNSGMDNLAFLAGSHHEKLDGSGYPFGLDEEELDIYKRIIVIADYYSALIEPRPYREPLHYKKALSILKEEIDRGKLDKKIYNELKNIAESDSTLQQARHEDALEDIFGSSLSEINSVAEKFLIN